MALPSVGAFNYSGFVERSDLIPYKAMMASENPMIKGKNISACLTTLDKKEFRVLRAENQALQKNWDNWRNVRRINYIAFGIIIFSACVLLSQIFKKAQLPDWVLISACFGVIAPIICPLTLGQAMSKADEKLASNIYASRLLRLQAKVRYLKQKIPRTLDQEEKEQLEQARDYFENRPEYFKEKTNKINVNANQSN